MTNEQQQELLENIITLLGKMMEHFEATDKLLEALVARQQEIENNLDVLFDRTKGDMWFGVKENAED